jgi:hypothetical protein
MKTLKTTLAAVMLVGSVTAGVAQTKGSNTVPDQNLPAKPNETSNAKRPTETLPAKPENKPLPGSPAGSSSSDLPAKPSR